MSFKESTAELWQDMKNLLQSLTQKTDTGGAPPAEPAQDSPGADAPPEPLEPD